MRPDVALELGWLNGYHHFIMPFFIQNMRQTHDRLRALEERTKPPKEEGNQDQIAQTYSTLGGFSSGMLMLENGGMGGMMPPQHGLGIDMSGFAVAGGMNPGMMPPGGMPGGMMPNGGVY